MAPTAEARARYARELVEHTMRQFTAARETLENPSSAAKRKHPAAHTARDGPRGRPARTTNISPRIISPANLVLPLSSCCFAPGDRQANVATRRNYPIPRHRFITCCIIL
ncbi:hypothetical protein DFH06DRAFT_1328904 [Mycena polygramma]|nr:hypothetical protein DFH06DRAFT_1328904 [Mycena polygramma]